MPDRRKRSRRVDEPLLQKVFYRRGTAEILVVLLHNDQLRFSEISQELPTISDQLVSTRLADLREIGVVSRHVTQGPPITSVYGLTSIGLRLARVADELKSLAVSEDLPSVAV